MAIEIFYKIQGGVVSRVKVEETSALPLDDFLYQLSKGYGAFSGMLPFGCLFTTSIKGLTCFVTQTTAKVYPVKYCRSRGDAKVLELKISVPFVQYYFVVVESTGAIQNVYMSVTKKPIMTEDEIVYNPPFLNIFDEGRGKICNGQMAINVSLPLNVRMNQYMSEFYVYNFNNDLYPRIPKGLVDDAEKYMKDWNDKTDKNPLFAVSNDIDYIPLKDEKDKPANIVTRANWVLRRETNG